MHPEEYPSRIAIRKVIAEGLLLYRQRASTLFILALLAVGTGQACLLFAAAFVRPQQFPLRALIGAAMMLTPLAAWLTLAETFAVTEERTRLQQVLLKPYGKCWRYIANATILSLLLAAIQVVPIFGYLFYAWFWLRLGLYVVILCVEPLDHHWLQPLSRSWKMMHGHVRTFFVAAIPPISWTHPRSDFPTSCFQPSFIGNRSSRFCACLCSGFSHRHAVDSYHTSCNVSSHPK